MKRVFGIILMGLACLWPINCVAAESALEVPKSLEFGRVSELGSSYTSSLKVKNTSETDVKVEMSFAPSEYELSDDAKKAVDWLAIVGGEVRQTVPAGEEKAIRIRATIPSDAPAGSQYATLVMKTGDAEEQKIAVRVDVMGDDFKVAGKLLKSGVRALGFDERVHTKAEIENVGTAGFVAKQVIRAKAGVSGTAEWRTLLEESAEVVPGGKLQLNSDAAESLGFGWYTVEQKISYVNDSGEAIEMTRAQLVLNCPWWLALLVGLVLVGLVAGLIIVKRKKKQEK